MSDFRGRAGRLARYMVSRPAPQPHQPFTPSDSLRSSDDVRLVSLGATASETPADAGAPPWPCSSLNRANRVACAGRAVSVPAQRGRAGVPCRVRGSTRGRTANRTATAGSRETGATGPTAGRLRFTMCWREHSRSRQASRDHSNHHTTSKPLHPRRPPPHQSPFHHPRRGMDNGPSHARCETRRRPREPRPVRRRPDSVLRRGGLLGGRGTRPRCARRRRGGLYGPQRDAPRGRTGGRGPGRRGDRHPPRDDHVLRTRRPELRRQRRRPVLSLPDDATGEDVRDGPRVGYRHGL